MSRTDNTPTLPAEDMVFLERMAADVLEASRVRAGERVGDFGPNTSGGTLIRPGGRDCYPAFWVRDYAMSLDSGLIPADEQVHALLVTARTQQEGDWQTPSGSLVPHGAIIDHVSFDGKAIFFPGTIDDYENQGGVWGGQPPFGDHFFFAHMAWHAVRASGDDSLLNRDIRGRSLLDRLELAFDVAPSREDTGLVWCDDENRGVAFGFYDSIIHTGELLFPSVLKYRAACQLAELCERAGRTGSAGRYRQVAGRIMDAILSTFADSGGLLRASTGKSCQPDVWGSCLAVVVGAIGEAVSDEVSAALAGAHADGTLAWRGNIRHVLTRDDARDDSGWDTTVTPGGKNRYQNGAYWSTPTGWVCQAVARTAPTTAGALAQDYVAELRQGDFRNGPDFGSPWECSHPDGDHRQNPVYMTSVTCPLASFHALGW